MTKFKCIDIRGVIPALVTPFNEHEEVDVERTKKLVNWLIEQGIGGFYLTGSTGEGFLMTPQERKLVVETVIEEVAGRVPVVVHVGAISTKISIDLAKHAQHAGADAISSVPPFYWRWDNDHIFKYYQDIAESTTLPMIIYNVPLAGLFSFDFIVRLAQIPNVKGVKYTAYTHQDIYKCKEALGDDFMVYSGADEMAVSGLLNGADGIIGSFYTMLPDLYVRLNQFVQKGDFQQAQRLQKIAVAIIDASLKHDYYAVIKEATRWMGVDAGYVRRPFQNCTAEQIAVLKADLKAIKERYQADDILVLKGL